MALPFHLSAYQSEQFRALSQAQETYDAATPGERQQVGSLIDPYLDFRHRVDRLLNDHFSALCTQACYQNQRSACCSRDGIITFWADVVINLIHSTRDQLDILNTCLNRPHTGLKCVYLTQAGCAWQIRPIVCAMFLCSRAEKEVFSDNPDVEFRWEQLKKEKKIFTWPDRPILFDLLEEWFIQRGSDSPLMYMHHSPGMVKVKAAHSLLVN